MATLSKAALMIPGHLGIVVRASGERQVEVGVPGASSTTTRLVMVKPPGGARPGVLRYRILANDTDDEAAAAAARVAVTGAKLHEPPMPLKNAKGGEDFAVKLPGEPAHRYRWARMSEGLVKTVRLDPLGLSRDNPSDRAHVEPSWRSGTAFSPQAMNQSLVQARKLSGRLGPDLLCPGARAESGGEEISTPRTGERSHQLHRQVCRGGVPLRRQGAARISTT